MVKYWHRDRERSTNLIRVQQCRRDRDLARTGSDIKRIEGTVERIDSRDLFELRERSGAKIIVSLPPNARQSVVANVERLRRGDHVLAKAGMSAESASSWRVCSRQYDKEIGIGTVSLVDERTLITGRFRKLHKISDLLGKEKTWPSSLLGSSLCRYH